MDANKLHLLLNYYPMVGTFLGICLICIGLWRKSVKMQRFCLWYFLAIALLTLPVYVSGEITGKEMVEGIFGSLIKEHKASGLITFLVIEVTGIAALIGLFLLYRRSQIAKWSVVLVLVLSLISAFLVTRTTLLGRGIKFGLTGGESKPQTNFQR